jgi:hypothetical protein
MTGKLRFLSTLTLMLFALTISYGQSAKKAQKGQATLAANVEFPQTAEKDYSYNTDLYDAISPGFATEAPKEKKRIYRKDTELDEPTLPHTPLKKAKQKIKIKKQE